MAATSQGRIRESWQKRRLEGTSARIWLIIRRTVASLIAIALLVVCAYLLFNLLWSPKTYFVHLTATAYRPHIGQPIQFAFGDFKALERLKDVVVDGAFSTPPRAPLTAKRLNEQLPSLSSLSLRTKDTLVVYLAAHGEVVVSDNGEVKANLLCESDGPWGEGPIDRVPVESVLKALKETRAGTKLLLLDAGQDAYGPRNGFAINTFPAALQREVDNAGDPRLWVLTANAPLERSHISPSRRRSVFGHYVAEGLVGAADANGDGDGTIELDELYAYVQPNVSAWVKFASDGHDTQTPLLLNSHTRESAPGIALLSIARLSAQGGSGGEQGDGIAENLVSASVISDAAQEALPPDARDAAERLGVDLAMEEGGEASEKSGPQNDSSAGQVRRDSRQAAVGRQGAQQALQNALSAAAALQQPGDLAAPSVFAPFLWRRQLDRLMWYEQCCTADLPVDAEIWANIARDLDEIHRSLEAYAQNDVGDVADEVVGAFLQFAPRVPPNLASADYISFALLEHVARHDPSQSIDKALGDFAEKYDALINQADGDSGALAALYGNKDQITLEELKRYYEFQLLELASNVDVPWELTRLVFRVRRLGEQTAASLLCGEGWCVEDIDAADALRWEGERHVLDQTSANWVEEAQDRLSKAEARYNQAQDKLRFVRDATRQRNALFRRLPDLIRWVHFGPRSQRAIDRDAQAVRRLMSCLVEVNQALTQPGGESIARLDGAMRALQQADSDINNEIEQSKTYWEKSRLLATTLPEPDERMPLRTEIRTLEERLANQYEAINEEPSVLNTPKPTELQLSQFARHVDLQIAFAQFAGYDADDIADLRQIQESLGPQVDGWERLGEVGRELDALHADVPPAVESVAEHGDLRDVTARSDTNLPALRGALAPWLVLAAAHGPQIDPEVSGLASILNDAAWYDLLVWHSDRCRRAIEDAPRIEIAFLQNSANEFRELAQLVRRQPERPLPRVPEVAISDAPDVVSLQQKDEAPIAFVVESSAAVPVWLVAQYDNQLLQVDGRGITSQEELRARANEARRRGGDLASTSYPYRPNLLNMLETLPAATGRTPLQLNVRRLSDAQGTTKLILKAISPNSYVRQEVEIVLPDRQQLEVLVDAPRDFWAPIPGGVQLRPFPNRDAAFPLSVSNRTKVPKKIDVYFALPSRGPTSGSPILVPSGPVRPDDPFFSAYGPFKQLGPKMTLELPASDEPVRIQLVPKDPMEEIDPAANLLIPNGVPPDKFTPDPLPHGILVVVQDRQRLTVRRIEIAPQRPRMYLQATAHFERDSGRLTIDVKARNPSIMPPEGVTISANFGPGLAQQYAAVLQPSDYSASLHARYLPNGPQQIRATVDVDNYPRAFIFDFDRNTSAANIRPRLDVREVRITEPAPEPVATFPPTQVLPVSLQVDGPENSRVEVGIDQTRDRFLDRDQKTYLNSDRQVEVVASSFAPDGTLVLHSILSDFKAAVPAIGLNNLEADLLAILSTGGQRDIRSQPVPIIIDGAPPDLQVRLRPGREVMQGTEIEVLVSTFTRELSGIQSVEAFIVPSASAGAESEKKPEAGKPAADGRWVVRLKTDDLEPGPYAVLVRATDKVGNSGEADPEDVDIVLKIVPRKLSEEEKKLLEANTVTGLVLYGGQPIDDATVELEPSPGPEAAPVKTDASGKFSFAKVPPGKYTLKARGLANGGWRRAEQAIQVPPRSMGPMREIKLIAETSFR